MRRDADGAVNLTIRSTARRGPAVEHSTGRGRIVSDWTPRDNRRRGHRVALQRPPRVVRARRAAPAAGAAAWLRRAGGRPCAASRSGAARRSRTSSSPTRMRAISTSSRCIRRCSTWPPAARSRLIEGAGADGLFVPLSYGRVRIAEQLPRHLVSHVRLRPESRDGVGVLDATLADEQGRVAAEIEGYVVKAVDPTRAERRPQGGCVRRRRSSDGSSTASFPTKGSICSAACSARIARSRCSCRRSISTR